MKDTQKDTQQQIDELVSKLYKITDNLSKKLEEENIYISANGFRYLMERIIKEILKIKVKEGQE